MLLIIREVLKLSSRMERTTSDSSVLSTLLAEYPSDHCSTCAQVSGLSGPECKNVPDWKPQPFEIRTLSNRIEEALAFRRSLMICLTMLSNANLNTSVTLPPNLSAPPNQSMYAFISIS